MLFVLAMNAQQKKLVTDKESLFTKEEGIRIDSMLQAYKQSSGNLVVVCTDSLDVSTTVYKDSLVAEYSREDMHKTFALFLLLSRKNGLIQLVSNELTKDMPNRMEAFLKIVSYGIPSIKEKRREEGVTIICKKAKEFLDSLPKN